MPLVNDYTKEKFDIDLDYGQKFESILKKYLKMVNELKLRLNVIYGKLQVISL